MLKTQDIMKNLYDSILACRQYVRVPGIYGQLDVYVLRYDAAEFSMGYCGPDNCFYRKEGK